MAVVRESSVRSPNTCTGVIEHAWLPHGTAFGSCTRVQFDAGAVCGNRIGPAYAGCKGGDCSMEQDPETWQGFPGCEPPPNTTGPGWQLCPALGFGQLMSMLPNSTKGLQW